MLEDPARDAWQKPHEVVMALKLEPADTVADIGAGSGYCWALPTCRPASVDLILCNVLHDIENRAAYYEKLKNFVDREAVGLLGDFERPVFRTLV